MSEVRPSSIRLGTLDDLFVGVAWKRLTPHEVDPAVSNGHEFQGVAKLRNILGTSSRSFKATYMLLSDEEEQQTVIQSVAKWYDSRQNQSHRSPEWRLYYPADAGQIQITMKADDFMVIALTKSGDLLIVLARAGSSREAQVRTLFALNRGGERVQLRMFDDEADADVSVLTARILELLGIAVPHPDPVGDGPAVLSLAAELLDLYPNALPPGREVSKMIRARLYGVDALADPDTALVRWLEAEDMVFRLWEDGLIDRRLEQGFDLPDGRKDVRAFRDFSMKIRQSRVSRAGGALQLHVGTILSRHKILHESQAVTENGERPDFLFPSAEAYHQASYPVVKLRMLGVKFTAKDRWRQVLNEAARIPTKHLLTMEAPISIGQINAMRGAALIPVIPANYMGVFSQECRSHLTSVAEFIAEVRLIQDC